MGFIADFVAGWKKQEKKVKQRQSVVKATILKISRGESYGGPVVAATVVVDEEVTLQDKAEALRAKLELDMYLPIIRIAEEACEKLGIAEELKGKNMVQKIDACLDRLGVVPSANAVDEEATRPSEVSISIDERSRPSRGPPSFISPPSAPELEVMGREVPLTLDEQLTQAHKRNNQPKQAELELTEERPELNRHLSRKPEDVVRETMSQLDASGKNRVLDGVAWGKLSWAQRRDRILEVGFELQVPAASVLSSVDPAIRAEWYSRSYSAEIESGEAASPVEVVARPVANLHASYRPIVEAKPQQQAPPPQEQLVYLTHTDSRAYTVRWLDGQTKQIQLRDGAFTLDGEEYQLRDTDPISFTWADGTVQEVSKQASSREAPISHPSLPPSLLHPCPLPGEHTHR